MIKYILRRLLTMIPVLLGVILLVYVVMSFAPGSPGKIILGSDATAEAVYALEEELGLHDPVPIRYVRYVAGLIQGDFGTSYVTGRPVAAEIFTRYPYTLNLAIAAAALEILVALPLGIIAAVKQNTIFDNISMIFSLIGISMPAFWLALMMMLLFSLNLGWFPVQGAEAGIRSYVLPAIAAGYIGIAAIARTTRSSMLETIRQDYIRTAKAKGVSRFRVLTKHAFRNALIPTMTVCGDQFGILLGGVVLTETIFAWPGVGRLMVQSVSARDTPMILGCIVLLAFSVSIINLIVDLLYGFVDPRVRSMYV